MTGSVSDLGNRARGTEAVDRLARTETDGLTNEAVTHLAMNPSTNAMRASEHTSPRCLASRDLIYGAISAERVRQERLFGGEHQHGCGTCASPHVADSVKAAVLAEECGEVARAVLEFDTTNLRVELVQVAAVAVAWLEGLAPADPAPLASETGCYGCSAGRHIRPRGKPRCICCGHEIIQEQLDTQGVEHETATP